MIRRLFKMKARNFYPNGTSELQLRSWGTSRFHGSQGPKFSAAFPESGKGIFWNKENLLREMKILF